MPCSLVLTLEIPEIDDESCIDPDSFEDYINKELNKELHPILRNKSLAEDFCQGHTLNNCSAKLASNLLLLAYLFYLTLDNMKKCIFHFHALRPL